MATPDGLTAESVFLGADALYVNMSDRLVFKMDKVVELMHEDIDDEFAIVRLNITDFLAFSVASNTQSSAAVAQVCELDNESEFWRHLGNSPFLLCVLLADTSLVVYDRETAGVLQRLDGLADLPEPLNRDVAQNNCIEAAICGDQLIVLASVQTRGFKGPVLLYLNERLRYCLRAYSGLPKEQLGEICAATISNRETVDMVTRDKLAPH